MIKSKFQGIFPAAYACYDNAGEVSEEKTKHFVNYLYDKGVQGLYVGGSSGECIYQDVNERKKILKYVAEELDGKLTLIAHVGAPSTRDSVILARYAEKLGYDALSAIPPIYYNLNESAIFKYWTEIMKAADLPFFIYNIPQTTGYSLSMNLFDKLRMNEKIIGIKNSSMPVMDIERFKAAGGEDFIVFNGADEQYISGRLIGADGGIGGTYGVMAELFLKAESFVSAGRFAEARAIQKDINDIIVALTSLEGSMYAVIKEILKLDGISIGGVREPLEQVSRADEGVIKEIKRMIDASIAKYNADDLTSRV